MDSLVPVNGQSENSGAAHMLVRYRWVLSAMLAAIVLALAPFIGKLSLTNEYAAQLGEDYAALLDYQTLEQDYASEDAIFITVAPNSGSVFAPTVLDLIEKITIESWQIPYSQRVDSLTNFQHVTATADDILVQDLFENSLTLSAADIEKKRLIALNELTLNNLLIAGDGKAAAISITLNFNDNREQETLLEPANYVRSMLSSFAEQYPNIAFRVTGKNMQDAAYFRAGKADGQTLFPLMFATIFLILFLCFGNVWLVLIIAACTGIAVAASAGVTGLSGVPYTVEGTAALVMIMPLAVADSVHVIINYLQFLASGSYTRPQAMRQSLQLNIKPIFITTLTTVIGFLSLNLTESPPVHLIGNTVATGMVFAFFISMTILPALTLLAPVKPERSVAVKWSSLSHLLSWVTRNRNSIFLVGVIVTLISAGSLPLNSLDQTSSEAFQRDNQFRKDSEWINDNLTGIERMNFILDSEEGIQNLDYLSALDNFANWLRQQPEVVNVNAFSDVVKRLNRTMHDDDPDQYTFPEAPDLIAQYVLFYEQSLPYGLDLTNQINFDKTGSRVFVVLTKMSNQEIVAFESRAFEWLENSLPNNISYLSASPSTMFAHQINRNIKGVAQGLLATIVLAAFTLMLALRSWKIGLASVLPNLVPIAMAFGLWGWLRADVGLLVILAMTISIGIVVDDTVHFLVKYRSARSRIASSENSANLVERSLRYAFSSTGMACLVTTLAIGAGFTVLLVSEFTPHAEMSLMCALTIAFAWLVDFIFLPSVLWHIDNNSESLDSKSEYTQ